MPPTPYLGVERSLENPEHLVLTCVKNGVLWLSFANLNMLYVGRVSIASSFCEAILFYIFFLQIMIYLIDKVLPESYFVNNLRALSVDMAVFRDLLRLNLPELSQHLDTLQKTANKESGGSDDSMLFYL